MSNSTRKPGESVSELVQRLRRHVHDMPSEAKSWRAINDTVAFHSPLNANTTQISSDPNGPVTIAAHDSLEGWILSELFELGVGQRNCLRLNDMKVSYILSGHAFQQLVYKDVTESCKRKEEPVAVKMPPGPLNLFEVLHHMREQLPPVDLDNIAMAEAKKPMVITMLDVYSRKRVNFTRADACIVRHVNGVNLPVPWLLMVLLQSSHVYKFAAEVFQLADLAPSLDLCMVSHATTTKPVGAYTVTQPLFNSLMDLVMSSNLDIRRRPEKARVLSWLHKVEKPYLARRVIPRPENREPLEEGKDFEGPHVLFKLCEYLDRNEQPLEADDWLAIQQRFGDRYVQCIRQKNRTSNCGKAMHFVGKFIDMYFNHRPYDELSSETKKWFKLISFLVTNQDGNHSP